MGKNVTIGGNRLGSGKKMRAKIDNYYRSTHNLSQDWASTAACGVLYPCLCLPAMRGDSFDIDLNAALRTIPTKAPLFGSFKMQVDIFQVPMRLYQGILHNNPLAIGLKMNQVLFPTLDISWNSANGDGKFSSSCLLKYLGMSGAGNAAGRTGTYHREILAIPALAYYDIFKNYYANKQEENAYVIEYGSEEISVGTKSSYYFYKWYNSIDISTSQFNNASTTEESYSNLPNSEILEVIIPMNGTLEEQFKSSEVSEDFIIYEHVYQGSTIPRELRLDQILRMCENATNYYDTELKMLMICRFIENVPLTIYNTYTGENEIINNYIKVSIRKDGNVEGRQYFNIKVNGITDVYYTPKDLALHSFELKNIDDMRYDLLSSNELGTKVKIEANTAYEPYLCLVTTDANNTKMNGLVVKTYQNDIFNNWLNTEWIEGENGINEITKVEIVDGAFSMDALNFAQKLYNMLNRIAVAGATYEDWQDVVYETVKRRQIESPIFCGGISKEIVFDEIIQNTPTELDGESQPLGTLGGRGRLGEGQKGGKVHIKCDEASFIIGIMSITPRIYYTQGNEFYMTELKSMDDLHKPAMDGIGFQDLIGERLAWFDTQVLENGTITRHKIGKLPAWIEYMTAVNKAYGEFAEPNEAGYMILARNYERNHAPVGIKDATTYIDPKKYNYAFANTELTAQNFWTQIGFNIKARRLMSARLIPHV